VSADKLFEEAVTDHLISLRALASERPAHAEYLEAILAAHVDEMEDVRVPYGVSFLIANALLDDVNWLRQPPPEPGMLRSQYAHAYRERRRKDARAAARLGTSRTAAPWSPWLLP
jgi:hypothetical protein